MTRKRQAVLVVLSFMGGVAATILVPALIRKGLDRWFFPEGRREITRTTSPDGTVDAVMEEVNCGVPCSLEYSVSIVPRGAAARADPGTPVFIGDDVVNPRIQWIEPHLLGIGYDRGLIVDFHNLTYPLGRPGVRDSYEYKVEIQLKPSSSRFSYLKEGGQLESGR
jgi:hypothetical protein